MENGRLSQNINHWQEATRADVPLAETIGDQFSFASAVDRLRTSDSPIFQEARSHQPEEARSLQRQTSATQLVNPEPNVKVPQLIVPGTGRRACDQRRRQRVRPRCLVCRSNERTRVVSSLRIDQRYGRTAKETNASVMKAKPGDDNGNAAKRPARRPAEA
jgi:hypothetical protein